MTLLSFYGFIIPQVMTSQYQVIRDSEYLATIKQQIISMPLQVMLHTGGLIEKIHALWPMLTETIMYRKFSAGHCTFISNG